MSRPHRRGSNKPTSAVLSQLIDWNHDGELTAVIKDLETDEVLSETSLGMVHANSPVLVSLRFKWRREGEPE